MRSFLLLVSLLLISCNTEKEDEMKITKTIIEFWDAVEQNDRDKYKSLIYESEQYPGVISMERRFLNQNYNKINYKIDLKENIKIKDTIWIGYRMKYVQYRISNTKRNSTKSPLLITFMFYEQIGYDKIFKPNVLYNFLDWE